MGRGLAIIIKINPNNLKLKNKYFQIHNVAIAELSSNQPEESEDVILKDIIYSVYLLKYQQLFSLQRVKQSVKWQNLMTY